MQVLVQPLAQSVNHVARVNLIQHWIMENVTPSVCTNHKLLAAWADWEMPKDGEEEGEEGEEGEGEEEEED